MEEAGTKLRGPSQRLIPGSRGEPCQRTDKQCYLRRLVGGRIQVEGLHMLVTEPVRLVIWDLDDTLWKGTITEGGIQLHLRENYETIRELARRGIMSSICSKNDFAPVKDILTEQGVWDYFIFPSINWMSKGSRIAAIVDAVQLRPETIMFIDDNPSNRAEALQHIPSMQVEDETIVPTLCADPRFKGKDDAALIRLQQYKLLEARHAEQVASDGDSEAFLRRSNIRVTIEYDIAAHLDRAIELINRTNQLNYTKIRLSDDLEAARAELQEEVGAFNRQAGLVHVTDNYGIYGFVGFFCMQTSGNGRTLRHFCFSCRTLGMEVERWLYDFLKRPHLKVIGPVLTELNEGRAIDWITLGAAGEQQETNAVALGEIRIRGGCELDPLVHYFNAHANEIRSETNLIRQHLFIRKNVSLQLPGIGIDPVRHLRELHKLGFRDEDILSRLFEPAGEMPLTIILSLWADRSFGHYRHKRERFEIACNLIHGQTLDLTKITSETVEKKFGDNAFPVAHREKVLNYIKEIQENYEYLGRLPSERIEMNTRLVFDALPKDATVFFVVPSAFAFSARGREPLPWSDAYVDAVAHLERDYPHVNFVHLDKVILDDSERLAGNDHFNRAVYHRLFEQILQRVRAVQGVGREGAPVQAMPEAALSIVP